MATKNEKLLASALISLIANQKAKGIEPSEDICALIPQIAAIIAEDDEPEKRGKTAEEQFRYTGVEFVTMSQAERDKKGICHFTVSRNGTLILDMYWDTTLEWIMQPTGDGKSFAPAFPRKFPGQAYARSFLKKLAEEELEEPGKFAKKYYRTRPSVIVRKLEGEPAPVQAEVPAETPAA
jgi:hypothetical protein